MKILLITILSFVICSCNGQHNDAPVNLNVSQKPIVVELFTSEGCSSCPSADKLLANISDKNQQVLLLSFHVDYWNRLGWVDSFSNAMYTNRQYDYAAKMQLSSVYTPQIVVNGQAETVGSNSTKVNKLLAANYLSAQIINKVDASINNKQIVVTIDHGNLGKDNELLVLLVQPSASTKVKAGENEGSLLQHKNVVRSMVVMPVGTQTTTLSAPFISNDWQVVALVQNKYNLQIVDAKQTIVHSSNGH
ncbi:DUF1223 domain-containing protein [Parasediminibacterium paludis]|uniref:DUF1223 domain-containing protein n=1 Tax=Parasediminibacterium paludis TaxID=908966 RepID=A0ABV8PSN7_9BACT